MKNGSSSQLVIFFLLTIIAANLLFLDLKVFSTPLPLKFSDISTIATPVPSPFLSQLKTSPISSCPISCLSLIEKATKGAELPIGSLPQGLTPVQQTKPVSPREFYIPLGSGSTTKSDWENLTATETVIDPSHYGTIKEAYFIASLRNPTQNGQVEAQLFNVTDKHQVWGSHVIMKGPLSQTITSAKIALDTGNKLYRVQLKSSMSFPVYLDNAKIRIIAE